MICTPWGYRVARVKKFKINVTSHLKIIILIIKDIQISKCDIIFENGRFWGAPDKPCGGGRTDANSKTVAIRYMIENKLVPLHYES